MDKKTIEDVLREFKINNANIVIRQDIDVDQLIDAIEENKVYLPAIVALNKIDMVGKDELEKAKSRSKPDICISGEKKAGIKELKELIYKKLRIISIYLKEFSKKADMGEPLIMWEGSTLRDLCSKLHKDFVEKFKFARIWGSSKFPGQHITKIDYILKDEDIVELRIK